MAARREQRSTLRAAQHLKHPIFLDQIPTGLLNIRMISQKMDRHSLALTAAYDPTFEPSVHPDQQFAAKVAEIRFILKRSPFQGKLKPSKYDARELAISQFLLLTKAQPTSVMAAAEAMNTSIQTAQRVSVAADLASMNPFVVDQEPFQDALESLKWKYKCELSSDATRAYAIYSNFAASFNRSRKLRALISRIRDHSERYLMMLKRISESLQSPILRDPKPNGNIYLIAGEHDWYLLTFGTLQYLNDTHALWFRNCLFRRALMLQISQLPNLPSLSSLTGPSLLAEADRFFSIALISWEFVYKCLHAYDGIVATFLVARNEGRLAKAQWGLLEADLEKICPREYLPIHQKCPLFRLFQSMSDSDLHASCCIQKLFFPPTTDPRDSLLRKISDSRMPSRVDPAHINHADNMARLMLLISAYRATKFPVQYHPRSRALDNFIRSYAGGSDLLVLRLSNDQRTAEMCNIVQGITLEPHPAYGRTKYALDMLKDVSRCPDIDKCYPPETLLNQPPSQTRIIPSFLRGNETNPAAALATCATLAAIPRDPCMYDLSQALKYPEAQRPVPASFCKLLPKQTEYKPLPRVFQINNPVTRAAAQFLESEAKVFLKFSGSAVTDMADFKTTEVIQRFSQLYLHEEDDQSPFRRSYGIFVNLDLSAWNSMFQADNSAFFYRLLAQVSGKHELVNVAHLFRNQVSLVTSGPDYLVAQLGEVGMEGILQSAWTCLTMLYLVAAATSANLSVMLMGSGDNQVAYVSTQVLDRALLTERDREELDVRLMSIVLAAFESAGHMPKLEETFASCFQVTLLKQTFRAGNKVEKPLKPLLGIHPFFTGISDELTGALNAGASGLSTFTLSNESPDIGHFCYILSAGLSMFEQCSKAKFTPSPAELALLCCAGSSLGPVSIIAKQTTELIGLSDELPLALCTCRQLLRAFPDSLGPARNLFTLPIEADQKTLPMLLLTGTHKLPLRAPATGARQYQRASARIAELYTTRAEYRAAFAYVTERRPAEIASALLDMQDPDLKLSASIFQESYYVFCTSLVAQITSPSTILAMTAELPGGRVGRQALSKLRRALDKQLMASMKTCEWIKRRIRHAHSLSPPLLHAMPDVLNLAVTPTQLAVHLRTLTGVPSPESITEAFSPGEFSFLPWGERVNPNYSFLGIRVVKRLITPVRASRLAPKTDLPERRQAGKSITTDLGIARDALYSLLDTHGARAAVNLAILRSFAHIAQGNMDCAIRCLVNEWGENAAAIYEDLVLESTKHCRCHRLRGRDTEPTIAFRFPKPWVGEISIHQDVDPCFSRTMVNTHVNWAYLIRAIQMATFKYDGLTLPNTMKMPYAGQRVRRLVAPVTSSFGAIVDDPVVNANPMLFDIARYPPQAVEAPIAASLEEVRTVVDLKALKGSFAAASIQLTVGHERLARPGERARRFMPTLATVAPDMVWRSTSLSHIIRSIPILGLTVQNLETYTPSVSSGLTGYENRNALDDYLLAAVWLWVQTHKLGGLTAVQILRETSNKGLSCAPLIQLWSAVSNLRDDGARANFVKLICERVGASPSAGMTGKSASFPNLYHSGSIQLFTKCITHGEQAYNSCVRCVLMQEEARIFEFPIDGKCISQEFIFTVSMQFALNYPEQIVDDLGLINRGGFRMGVIDVLWGFCYTLLHRLTPASRTWTRNTPGRQIYQVLTAGRCTCKNQRAPLQERPGCIISRICISLVGPVVPLKAVNLFHQIATCVRECALAAVAALANPIETARQSSVLCSAAVRETAELSALSNLHAATASHIRLEFRRSAFNRWLRGMPTRVREKCYGLEADEQLIPDAGRNYEKKEWIKDPCVIPEAQERAANLVLSRCKKSQAKTDWGTITTKIPMLRGTAQTLTAFSEALVHAFYQTPMFDLVADHEFNSSEIVREHQREFLRGFSSSSIAIPEHSPFRVAEALETLPGLPALMAQPDPICVIGLGDSSGGGLLAAMNRFRNSYGIWTSLRQNLVNMEEATAPALCALHSQDLIGKISGTTTLVLGGNVCDTAVRQQMFYDLVALRDKNVSTALIINEIEPSTRGVNRFGQELSTLAVANTIDLCQTAGYSKIWFTSRLFINHEASLAIFLAMLESLQSVYSVENLASLGTGSAEVCIVGFVAFQHDYFRDIERSIQGIETSSLVSPTLLSHSQDVVAFQPGGFSEHHDRIIQSALKHRSSPAVSYSMSNMRAAGIVKLCKTIRLDPRAIAINWLSTLSMHLPREFGLLILQNVEESAIGIQAVDDVIAGLREAYKVPFFATGSKQLTQFRTYEGCDSPVPIFYGRQTWAFLHPAEIPSPETGINCIALLAALEIYKRTWSQLETAELTSLASAATNLSIYITGLTLACSCFMGDQTLFIRTWKGHMKASTGTFVAAGGFMDLELSNGLRLNCWSYMLRSVRTILAALADLTIDLS